VTRGLRRSAARLEGTRLTHDTYQHVLPGMQQRAADKIGAILQAIEQQERERQEKAARERQQADGDSQRPPDLGAVG
jgi:hypothetical protein